MRRVGDLAGVGVQPPVGVAAQYDSIRLAWGAI